jgi:hypothetical protein
MLALALGLLPLPWAAFYGISGIWAVLRAALALSDGQSLVFIGEGHVSPVSLLIVGVAFIVGFLAMVMVSVLVLLGHRGRLWPAELALLLVVSVVAVWAAVRTGLGLGPFLVAFGGLLYSDVLAVVMLRARRPHVVPAYDESAASGEAPAAASSQAPAAASSEAPAATDGDGDGRADDPKGE